MSIYCPQCGAENKDDAQYCAACGYTPLKPDSQEAKPLEGEIVPASRTPSSSSLPAPAPQVANWLNFLYEIDMKIGLPVTNATAALVSLVYIINPGAGVVEFIPDIVPFVGNLDEAAAALILWYTIVNMKTMWEQKKGRKPGP